MQISDSDVVTKFSTLVDLLQYRALHQAHQPAYTFLLDGETQEAQLSYQMLDLRARSIGALLQSVTKPGERALLLYPPGLDYIAAFFGCLYANVVAVPAYPPTSTGLKRTLPRLQAIVRTAQPAVALTTDAIIPIVEPLSAQGSDFQRIRWLSTDAIDSDAPTSWRKPDANGDTLTFLQYTSGSTATPKGVMLTHANLLHNLSLIQQAFGHHADSQGVIWLPPYHDMGLIGGVLQPLYAGFPVTLLSPVSFLQRPLRWLQAISRYKATTSGGPNFAYDLCIQKITQEQRQQLDLSSWTVAFNGAEPIRAATLERFASMFAECGFRREAFYPCYGMAEATLIISGGQLTAPPIVRAFQAAPLEQHQVVEATAHDDQARLLVSSGQALVPDSLAIVNPNSLINCEPGQVGEIWVTSPSVAVGYWAEPGMTAQSFQARIANMPEASFLRTGDLGFVHDGEVFVTGRLKDLIIIRGRNYYPQDIEQTVERSHPAFRPDCGAAFSVDLNGEERLVVVQELDRQHRNPDIPALTRTIRQAVTDYHEVYVYAVVLIKHGSIFKTSSGKIQRHACRSAFLQNSLVVIGQDIHQPSSLPEGKFELNHALLRTLASTEQQQMVAAYLQQRVADVLHIPPSSVSLDHSLNTLGLDSLMAVELQYSLEQELTVVISMARFLEGPSIAELATEVVAALSTQDHEALTLPARSQTLTQDYPLSHGQKALWFLQQLAPTSAAYNIASAVRISATLDQQALQHAIQSLVDRHAALRTSFPAQHGTPAQRVHENVPVAWCIKDSTGDSEAVLNDRLSEEVSRPFNLEQAPLLRITLYTRSESEYILLLVVHHIVADLWSLAVFVRELSAVYAAATRQLPLPLTPLELQYTDYVRWQQELLAGPAGERLWAYWQQQLAGVLPVLDLPTDYPRPAIQSYRGASQTSFISPARTQQLKHLSEQHATTLATTLLAAFQALLSRYTGQTDLLIGMTTGGRSRAKLADLVGYFVNPVAIRTDLSGNPSFLELLEQVRQTVLGAFAHQDYPFSLLVEQLQPERDPSRSPIVQVMFTMQQTPVLDAEGFGAFALGEAGARLELAGMTIESVVLPQQTAQFDLLLAVGEVAEGLSVSFQYNTDLFAATTIARMAEHFTVLLDGLAADPDQPITRLPLLPDAERDLLLHGWNATQMPYPPEQLIHRMIEAQVARTPAATALVCGEQRLSYEALNARANQLAHHLRAHGVTTEVGVGVYLERTPDLLVALLAILKAGGWYTPLDPAYPAARVAQILHDSQVALVLTDSSLQESLPALAGACLCLDQDAATIAGQPSNNLAPTADSASLAYVIYTSGSTGQPKGVAIAHHSAVQLLAWLDTAFTSDQLRHVLAGTSIGFDLSIFELFGTLSVGGCVHLVANVLALATLPIDAGITLLNTVPSAVAELLRQQALPPSIEVVNLAGEALPRALVNDLVQARPSVAVYNLYGPSEDTTYSTYARVDSADSGVPPIGRPISNTQAYVLDEALEPVPIGVAGELYLGGAGLARGYLHRADLTAARFVPNLFGPEPGGRLYRTGDRVRYRPDGQLEFLGRRDHQIKLRGFRIELGEIEVVLRQHPVVREAIVLARQDIPGDMRLVAYLVPASSDEHQEPGSGIGDIRGWLTTRLPEYMVPSAFVILEALPLSPNGKVDRQALPMPDQTRPELHTMFSPPRTAIEAAIAQIWTEVLQINKVGIHDNFFALGGHSLLATQVTSRLREMFQVEIPVHRLFEAPTVAGLAQHIEAVQWVAGHRRQPRINDEERVEERL
jgi:amino acid adenylation domain-containing protein